MNPFLNRHPFIKILLQISSVIAISFTTFIGCLITFFIILIVLIAVLISSLSGETGNKYHTVYGNKNSDNKILSIPVDGVIMGDKEQSGISDILGGDALTYGYEVKREIAIAAKDPEIKAIMLEIDSPGGTIFGAHAITDAVEAYKHSTGKPVYAHVTGMAASGAYWAATSADKIIVDYGSLVGSIGVIFGPFQYYDKVLSVDGGLLGGGVVTQNGIQQFYFTAGKGKDFGNPFRKLSDDEITNSNLLVTNEYDDFVNQVSSKRGIATEYIRNSIGAYVYDNKRAERLHLIDATGSKEDAYVALARRVSLETGNFQVVMQKKNAALPSVLNSFAPNRTIPKALSICFNSQLLSYYGNLADLCSR
jgi:protease-4